MLKVLCKHSEDCIMTNGEKRCRIMDLLPHGLESGNHSQQLFGQMMTDQNHQHQILIQRLMYHQTCPATRREKILVWDKNRESLHADSNEESLP
jgi:hypothetical protein